jgi:hypothetical protein
MPFKKFCPEKYLFRSKAVFPRPKKKIASDGRSNADILEI